MTPAGMCMNYSHTCRLDPLAGRVMRKVYVLISSSSTAGIVGAY